jgi:DNA-binding transcriptional ArsR family regulator
VLLALSDSARRAILERLAKGPARVGEIAASYLMSLNVVSRTGAKNSTYWSHILPKGAAGDDFDKAKYDRIDLTRLIPASSAEICDARTDPRSPGSP